jgi:hypothetical protein
MTTTHDRILRILESGHPIELEDYGSDVLAAWQRGYDSAMSIAIGVVKSDRLNVEARAGRVADFADSAYEDAELSYERG